MKKIKRIKWENIVTVAMIILDVICILHHIEINGIYSMLGIEIGIYAMSTIGVRYLIKDIRTNPSNWLID